MAEIGQMKSKGSTDYKCPICKDTGRVFFDKDGYSYVDDCECGLLKKQAMARRLKFADIPESFKEMTLDTFKTDIYQDERSERIIQTNVKAVNYWLDHFDEMKKRGQGLYFYSYTKGSGKTRLATSIANELMTKRDVTVKFTTSIQLIDEIKATWDKDYEVTEHQLLLDLSKTEVLIIDDFGIEEAKAWLMERFYQVINNRYIANLITIFTSNIGLENLKYDDRITNRIKERSLTLAFPEESIRDQIYKKNMAELAAAIA